MRGRPSSTLNTLHYPGLACTTPKPAKCPRRSPCIEQVRCRPCPTVGEQTTCGNLADAEQLGVDVPERGPEVTPGRRAVEQVHAANGSSMPGPTTRHSPASLDNLAVTYSANAGKCRKPSCRPNSPRRVRSSTWEPTIPIPSSRWATWPPCTEAKNGWRRRSPLFEQVHADQVKNTRRPPPRRPLHLQQPGDRLLAVGATGQVGAAF